MVGASAGICGLLAALAMLQPDAELYLAFVFPLKARHVLLAMFVLSGFLLLSPAGGHVAHGAHLGGLIGGVAFIKFGWHRDFVKPPWEEWIGRFKSGRAPAAREKPKLPVLIHAGRASQDRPGRPEPTPADFISREVDPILDKIASQGIHSLTAREREILEAARKKMSKR